MFQWFSAWAATVAVALTVGFTGPGDGAVSEGGAGPGEGPVPGPPVGLVEYQSESFRMEVPET